MMCGDYCPINEMKMSCSLYIYVIVIKYLHVAPDFIDEPCTKIYFITHVLEIYVLPESLLYNMSRHHNVWKCMEHTMWLFTGVGI